MNLGWITTLFFILGVIAAVTVVMVLFSSWGKRPKRLLSTGVPPVDSDDFVRGIAQTCNAVVNSQSELPKLLNNGDEFFEAMHEDISNAKKTVNVMIYIFESGQIASRFLDLFIRKVKEGVKIRVLLDGFGAINAPYDKVRELVEAGGIVNRYRPLKLGKLTRFYRRNHRRAVVIDGLYAYIGGGAMADYWTGQAQDPDHWRDNMIRVAGNMAQSVQSAFAQVWADSTGEILVGEEFYPDLRVNVNEESRGSATSTRFNDGPNNVRYVSVISSPTSEMHPLSRLFWLSFAAAREKIYIANSYFVPTKDIRKILRKKAKEGVDVRLLLPNRLTDALPIYWASHRYYDQLLLAGVKIYEYQPTMMHAKTVAIDNKWSIVGSANLDIRSLYLNKENVIGVLNVDFANELEKTFFADLEKSKEITLEQWRKRPFYEKIPEKLVYFLEEQL